MAAVAPRKIAQIAVTVSDVERAKTFYRDVLGLQWLADAPPGLSFFQCGEVRLMLGRPEGPDTGNSILYYSVDDAQAAYDSLSAKGVGFEAKPHVVGRLGDREVSLAICRDSEGNMLGLMSERAV
ncbi:VOC family protein [Allosphingosinicella sp.]|jgi:methylmalonyl-CoA/ethylmalonyl-CoA epimerase|uniref:VOC family protein n=1 Tax=Allosphingosinicella sp. TaxID=2823234 RepID=UPI002EF76F9B